MIEDDKDWNIENNKYKNNTEMKQRDKECRNLVVPIIIAPALVCLMSDYMIIQTIKIKTVQVENIEDLYNFVWTASQLSLVNQGLFSWPIG